MVETESEEYCSQNNTESDIEVTEQGVVIIEEVVIAESMCWVIAFAWSDALLTQVVWFFHSLFLPPLQTEVVLSSCTLNALFHVCNFVLVSINIIAFICSLLLPLEGSSALHTLMAGALLDHVWNIHFLHLFKLPHGCNLTLVYLLKLLAVIIVVHALPFCAVNYIKNVLLVSQQPVPRVNIRL